MYKETRSLSIYSVSNTCLYMFKNSLVIGKERFTQEKFPILCAVLALDI